MMFVPRLRLNALATLAAACLLLHGCGGGGGGGDTASTASGVDGTAMAAAAGPNQETTTTSSVVNNDGTTTTTTVVTSATGATSTTVTTTDATGATVNSNTTGNTSSAAATAMTAFDAWRLADQSTFGPTEAVVASIKTMGATAWLQGQFAASGSAYTSGGNGAIHQYTGSGSFCDNQPSTCWRDYYSSIPLVWDFYRNAISKPDQLRQRVAFALNQILVISGLQLEGTYGFRNYQNMLLSKAFGNYGDVLKAVMLSPIMGDYLNGVNNDKAAPNENFAREALQLFSLGNCLLNSDGTQAGGKCQPVYDNDMVRNYAYALTGWTYPAGGATPWGCWPSGTNCRYYNGDMVPVAALHDTTGRTLLSNVALPAGQGAAASMGYVLSSIMAHPNIGPFIGKQLIQKLVTSNPSPAYVSRVASAFNSGKFTSGGASFGAGTKGDLTATVAAILLDPEARGEVSNANSGKLREPALYFTGVLRQYAGSTDGDALSWWWGDLMRQHVFRPPSVFNFYPPDFPVSGTNLLGPEFGLHGASAAMNRLNFLTYLIDWGGSTPDSTVPNAVGTKINFTSFTSSAGDAAALVDRLSVLATGKTLADSVRSKIVAAVDATSKTDATARTKTAAYLVLATPDYQVAP